MNNQKRNIWIMALAFICLVALQVMKPKPLDWTASYSREDKIPYGCFVLYERLMDIFPGSKIENTSKTIYETIAADSLKNFNYIFIQRSVDFKDLDEEYLLRHVARGNEVFIASEYFYGELADTLKLTIGNHDYPEVFNSDTVEAYVETDTVPQSSDTSVSLQNLQDSITLNFVHPDLVAAKSYGYKRGTISSIITSYDTLHTLVVGKNNFNEPFLIRIQFGKGYFWICSTPKAFTNYNILKRPNQDFVAKSFAGMNPGREICWDEYYKDGKHLPAQTPLRYILTEPALSWAYFLTLCVIFVFVIFEAKRRQRVIPVVLPHHNTTLEFTETLGRLYFNKGTHLDMAEKKINYLLEYIRSSYHLDTRKLNGEFTEKLTLKSGKDKSIIKTLIQQIEYTRKKSSFSEQELITLNKWVEKFYNK